MFTKEINIVCELKCKLRQWKRIEKRGDTICLKRIIKTTKKPTLLKVVLLQKKMFGRYYLVVRRICHLLPCVKGLGYM